MSTRSRSRSRSKIQIGASFPELIPRVRRLLISGFVAFNIFTITLFAFPLTGALTQTLRDALSPYPLCLGMTETWDTFAPNPKSSEQFMKAMVLTEQGDTLVYSFPRMETLSFFERYRSERYRKFVESVSCKECAGLWPDVERMVARQMDAQTDHPARVMLIDFESPIDPLHGLSGEDSKAKPTLLSELTILPEDLR